MSELSKRETNYDLLRVFALLAIMSLHVSSVWIDGFSAIVREGGAVETLTHPLWACVWDCLPRFGVPCFLMLSGAFLLANPATGAYAAFYKKSWRKLGGLTVGFSVFYLLIKAGESVFAHENPLLAVGGSILILKPYYHMWYLAMLVGVYALAPFVWRFKDTVGEKAFAKVAVVFLILGSISGWTSGEPMVAWDIGRSFEYLGYFMTGYVLRQRVKKSNGKGLGLIAAGLVTLGLTSLIQYQSQIVAGVKEKEQLFNFVSPFSPTAVVGAVLMFAGFAALTVKRSAFIEKLAGASFVAYLLHVAVWEIVKAAFYLAKGSTFLRDTLDPAWAIPAFAVAVFAVTLPLSMLLLKIRSRLHAKRKAKADT